MNHHVAAIGVIFSLLVTIWFVLDLGPYAAFTFAFVAVPVLFVCAVFYYVREVLRELRRREVL